jgi:5-methylcytosine-specific restriction endonuclease McrA
MAKDFSKALYNSSIWRTQIRPAVLKRCRYICETPGCWNPATEVDHIKELTEENIRDPKIAYDMKNLQGLCSACHKAKTKAEQESRKAGAILATLYFNEDGEVVVR